MKLLKQTLPYFLLLLVAALAFYPVIAFQHPMVYDMTDCFYPWRFHIGECLQNGMLPFWDPYQDLGYPIHADPSSGAWYPMVWLIGGTVGYSIKTIGMEFFLHVFLAGVGMLHLTRTFRFDPRVGWIAALSYMLCGLFVSNAQHLPYIISAAWLPFLLSHYFRMILRKKWQNGLFAGVFLSFMLTGGYPAFVIILFYFLLITAAIYFYRAWKEENKFPIGFTLRHCVFGFTAALFAAGLLVSVIQVSPYLSRLEGFTVQQALYSPFGPPAFLTFVFPYAAAHFPEFFQADISMVNGYFGFGLFIVFLLGIFRKKSLELRLLLGLALFSLLAGVGDSLPLREFLYHYIPGMGVFRFPAVFRIFFILPAILIAANYLNTLITSNSIQTQKLIKPLVIGSVVLFVLLLLLRLNGPLNLKAFVKDVVWYEQAHGTIQQHIAFQAIIQIILLISLVVVLKFIRRTNVKYALIGLLLSFDLISAVRLNGRHTVYYPQIPASEAFQNTNILAKGFPLPKSQTLAESAALPGPGRTYWQNYHNFYKEVTADGFNSFSLGNYERLEAEYPFIFKTMQQNKLVFISDTFGSNLDMAKDNSDSLYVPNKVYFNSGDLKTITAQKHLVDSAAQVKLIRFDPNEFEVQVQNSHSAALTIMQKTYPGWEVYIDGIKKQILVSNLNFMSVDVPEGKHTVRFTYSNGLLKAIYLMQFMILPMILIFGIWYSIRHKAEPIPMS